MMPFLTSTKNNAETKISQKNKNKINQNSAKVEIFPQSKVHPGKFPPMLCCHVRSIPCTDITLIRRGIVDPQKFEGFSTFVSQYQYERHGKKKGICLHPVETATFRGTGRVCGLKLVG